MITTVRQAVISQAVAAEAAITEAAVTPAVAEAAIQAAVHHTPSDPAVHMAAHQEEPVQEDISIIIMNKIYKGPAFKLVLYLSKVLCPGSL